MSTLHALIIEDNTNNSEVLSLLLAQEGINSTSVSATRYVAQALDQLERIDAIFLDLEFPIGDGFDVFAALRRDTRLDSTPIIAYSVHTSEIDKVRSAGFDGFLGKPLNAGRFPDQLRRILNGRAVWEA